VIVNLKNSFYLNRAIRIFTTKYHEWLMEAFSPGSSGYQKDQMKEIPQEIYPVCHLNSIDKNPFYPVANRLNMVTF